MGRRLASTLTVVLTLAASNPAAAQEWIELSTVGGPSVLEFHGFDGDSVAYDPVANRLILFLPRNIGFANEFSPDPAPTGQVWVLSNANGLGGTPAWTKLATGGSPLPAIHFAATGVYDQASGRLTVYGGGFFHTSPPLNGSFVLTHANNLGGSATWSLLSATGASCFPFGQAGSCTGSNARLQDSAVYDPASGRMISFGGHTAFFFSGMNDTRVLTNANGLGGTPTWLTLATAGGPPAVRGTHSAVYDAVSNRMVVFGGWDVKYPSPNFFYNDVWILDGATGLAGTPTWLPQSPLGAPPSPRGSHSAVYDAVNNRMLVYGGRLDPTSGSSLFFDEVWELSDANAVSGTPGWSLLTPAGTGPGPLAAHGAAFDAQSQRMIVVGGRNASGNHQLRVFVLAFVREVAIDIKPGSDPNCFNNDGRGVIPVAILSSADFDATAVDPSSVSLDGQSVRVVGKKGTAQAHVEDVNDDQLDDLVLQILDQDGTYTAGTTTAILTGATFDGRRVRGTDSICIVP